MKRPDPPREIYLQWEPNREFPDPWSPYDLGDITWFTAQVNDDDVKYVRAADSATLERSDDEISIVYDKRDGYFYLSIFGCNVYLTQREAQHLRRILAKTISEAVNPTQGAGR